MFVYVESIYFFLSSSKSKGAKIRKTRENDSFSVKR